MYKFTRVKFTKTVCCRPIQIGVKLQIWLQILEFAVQEILEFILEFAVQEILEFRRFAKKSWILKGSLQPPVKNLPATAQTFLTKKEPFLAQKVNRPTEA